MNFPGKFLPGLYLLRGKEVNNCNGLELKMGSGYDRCFAAMRRL
jgi:hypothetical protein